MVNNDSATTDGRLRRTRGGGDTPAVANEPKWSRRDLRQRNQYNREFLPGMLGYGITLSAVLALVDEESTWAPALFLLPVLPTIWMAFAVYRSLRRADEYDRLVQYKAMSLAFGVAMIASVAFGFVGIVVDGIGWGPWIIFSLAMGTWGISVFLLRRD